MPVFNNILAGSSGQADGYDIEQSLRFDGSSYFSQAQTQNNNRQKHAFSFWFKLTKDSEQWLFSAYNNSSSYTGIYIDGSDRLVFYSLENTSTIINLITSRVFRDYGNWYHVFLQCNTAVTTPGSNDIGIWINGEKITDFDTETYPYQNYNTEINENGATHYFGQKGNSSNYYQGYLAEVYYMPGSTALARSVSDFGETDEATGKWIPKEYTGAVGAAGFYLPFADSSDLGKDYSDSSQDRNYTSNGFTANDQVLDSPTNNFATLNSLYKGATSPTFSEGNLKAGLVASGTTQSTILMPSGTKWYGEFVNLNSNSDAMFGVGSAGINMGNYPGNNQYALAYHKTGNVYYNGSTTAYGPGFSVNDIVGVAIDVDNKKIYFHTNGTWANSADPAAGTGGFTVPDSVYTDDITFAFRAASNISDIMVANFGQDSSFAGNKTAQNNTDSNGKGDFYYAPPSGYLALCEDNLPNPSIVLPGEHFNTVLYSGDGSASNSITGVGFQPDLSWIKTRNDTQSHMLNDVVRGVNKSINSDTTNAEFTDTDRFLSFDVDGFTVGADGSVNGSGDTLVSWNWKADNTSGSSNTDGTITSTVSANPTAGFSIVKYTGNATAGATVGHGLSQAPDFMLVKQLDAVKNWSVYYGDPTDYLILNGSNSTADDDRFWNDTAPGASVFTLGGLDWVNASGNDYIAYCFHSVEGYSKVGLYTGNGSTDGPFIYTGFNVSFVIAKAYSTTGSWRMYDSKRSPYNEVDKRLRADTTAVEDTNLYTDFLSNGFKIRTNNAIMNGSGVNLIYMAFAESPFKYSNAR